MYSQQRATLTSRTYDEQFVWTGTVIDCSDSLTALVQLRQLLEESGDLPPLAKPVWIFADKCLVIDWHWEGLRIAFDLECGPRGLRLSVLGRTVESRKFLRNALVGRGEAIASQGERHVVGLWGAEVPYETVVNGVLRHVLWLNHYMLATPNKINQMATLPAQHVAAYWWDGRPNFGDTIGPWLIQKISSKRAVNVRQVEVDAPTLYSVGSIVQLLEKPGSLIWGSGLIRPIDTALKMQLSNAAPKAILAVRGKLTRSELRSQLDWNVPPVFGDPAILLPRFFRPSASEASAGKIAVVPHWNHKHLFKQAPGDEQIKIVNVEQGMEAVVSDIANASHCVSTSLHGVIVAQAYGVPWVWLRIGDIPLLGDRFKFEDFFSMFDRDAVSELDIAEADVDQLDFYLLALKATLPRARSNFDDLLEAFPQG